MRDSRCSRKPHGVKAGGLDGVEDAELEQTSISIGWEES